MSLYSSSYQAGIDQHLGRVDCLADAISEYPEICEVLMGVLSEDKKSWKTWPATVMLFLEGGKVKFCLSPQQGPQVAFGCVRDLSKGLASIEDALRAGEFEWKKRKRSS